MASLSGDFASSDRYLHLDRIRVRISPLGNGLIGSVLVQLQLFDTTTGVVLPAQQPKALSLTNETVLNGMMPTTNSGWLTSNSANLVAQLSILSSVAVTVPIDFVVESFFRLARDQLF
jgi:hypothetical protein